MSDHARARALPRRALAAFGTLALTASGVAFAAVPAQAAEQEIDGATFAWSISTEAGGGAYFGGCNFLSAGAAGNSGSSRLWTEADGFYAVEDGNVHVEKPNADGDYIAPSWSTKCQDRNGNNVNTGATSTSETRFVFSEGVGTVDLDAGTANVSWEGSATIVFYGGLTYWTISDPELVVEDGVGQITGTATGYGADMNDPGLWVPLDPAEIVIADLSAVTLTEDGFTATPDYLGVEVEVGGGGMPQQRTGANWGAFPQSWVDYNIQTGQSSYWYSSGGAADPKKPTTPLTIGWSVDDSGDPGPGPGEGEPIDIDVTIPEDDDPGEPEPGSFSWTIDGAGAINLQQAAATEQGFSASGNLHPVIVTDTRVDSAGWTINGQANSFVSGSNSFSSSALGWSPSISDAPSGVEAGVVVNPGSGGGLSTARTLARSNEGVTSGEVTVQAVLNLLAPGDTPAGAYRSTLTLTALS